MAKWSDRTNWVMGIAAALLVMSVGAMSDRVRELLFDRSDFQRSGAAFMIGRDSALALAKAQMGDDGAFIQLSERINQRLVLLGVDDAKFPKDPSADKGKAVADFVNLVAGRLGAIHVRLDSATKLGFVGLVHCNTPSMFADIDFFDLAKKSGLEIKAGANKCEAFNALSSQIESQL